MKTRNELVQSYDQLAAEFAKRYCDELNGKPFDRSLLERFSKTIPAGTVCDIGCGPGHVAAYLKSLGVDVMGIDLSPMMIAEAKQRFSSIHFQVGDMLDLKMKSGSLSGIVAFYSIIHLSRDMLQRCFSEMNRVLIPKGRLLVSFHKGRGELHEDGVLDTQISFDCTLFEPNEVEISMEKAGFSIVETTIRRPYETEYPTERVYIIADKMPS
jgi:SAM-dependent methyltransferase